MVKIYSLLLFFSIFLIGGLQAQVPVMNPITGASVVCSPPSSAPVYSASASNAPTSYSWIVVPSASVVIATPSSSTTSINFPTPNGTYTVYCFATNGSGSSSPVSFVVNVFETPNVTFSGATSFCQGSSTNIMASSTMMSASPTIFYGWSPPTGLNTTFGQFVSASPTTVTNYTVNAMNGSCIGTGTITITPLPSPTITATVSSNIICPGDPITINASGALTYTVNSTWSSNLPLGTPFSPPVSAPYFVNGTNSFGCSSYSNALVYVTINPAPSISVGANPPMACMGQSVALTFSGTSTSYSINGVACGNSVAVTPTVQTTYTISGVTSAGCKGSTLSTVYIGCVGINGQVITEPKGLSVYPNPSAGQFNLSSGKNETVRIVNELGQLVKNIDLKADAPVMISDLSPGVYFVMSQDTRIKIIVLQ
jgi:hypothetical protein